MRNMEILLKKVGGPFQLTVLIQKRLKELQAGRPKLIDTDTNDLKEIVFREILEDKIKLNCLQNELDNTDESDFFNLR